MIPAVTAALIALLEFRLTVNSVRLWRILDAMIRFGLLPAKYLSFKISEMTG